MNKIIYCVSVLMLTSSCSFGNPSNLDDIRYKLDKVYKHILLNNNLKKDIASGNIDNNRLNYYIKVYTSLALNLTSLPKKYADENSDFIPLINVNRVIDISSVKQIASNQILLMDFTDREKNGKIQASLLRRVGFKAYSHDENLSVSIPKGYSIDRLRQRINMTLKSTNYKQVTTKEVLDANKISDPTKLKIGQYISIPLFKKQ